MQVFEDCAGWFGAEPHASETGHGSAYHLCRTGCAQRHHHGGAGWRGPARRRAQV